MDDFFKSFLDGWSSRAKHPLIASFVLANIALNWQAYALLIWGSPPFEERMELFRATTGQGELVWQPLALGLLMVVILPLASFGLSKATEWATSQHKLQVERQVHNLRSERARLEDERETAKQIRAKNRLEEIGNLARRRNELEDEVGSDAIANAKRELTDEPDPSLIVDQLTQPQIAVLFFLNESSAPTPMPTADEIPSKTLTLLKHRNRPRASVELRDANNSLIEDGYVAKMQNSIPAAFHLTTAGYKLMDSIESEALSTLSEVL